jgi:hypothetical protein
MLPPIISHERFHYHLGTGLNLRMPQLRQNHRIALSGNHGVENRQSTLPRNVTEPVVMWHCCSHCFSRCRSWVNVSKLRTGLGSRSCGTATKISVAPRSMPAALGSMPLRLGTAPPWPARFGFFVRLRLMLFSPRSRGGPSRLLSGNLLIGIAAVQHNRVTPVSITKLGTKLGNGLEAPLRSRPTSHDHDGYEHTFSHTLFAAPSMPLCSLLF